MSNTTKRTEWEKRICEWETSGMSKSRWCRERGYKVNQMYYWLGEIDESESHLKKHRSISYRLK